MSQCAGIGGSAAFIQSALVTDTDALVVPPGNMGAYLMHRTADMYFPVTGDVKMITDTGKAPLQMTSPKSLHREITIAACSAAMNYQEANLPIVLIETA